MLLSKYVGSTIILSGPEMYFCSGSFGCKSFKLNISFTISLHIPSEVGFNFLASFLTRKNVPVLEIKCKMNFLRYSDRLKMGFTYMLHYII